MDNYEELMPIGEGAFGEVHLVFQKITKQVLAMKKVLLVQGHGLDDRRRAKKEVTALTKLKHNNIVTYIESFEVGRHLHIVMAFYAGGDLWEKIEHKKKQKKITGTGFTTHEILSILQQLCQAISYVHSQHIIHRDIKPRNIFFADEERLKLGDFGLVKILDSSLDHASTHNIGTLQYSAPEIFTKEPYGNKCDMWSLGCVMYELVSLKKTFGDNDYMTLITNISNAKYEPLPPDVDSFFKVLIVDLIKKKESMRPPASVLVTYLEFKMRPPRDFNLLLIGPTGVGKSATGNSILGRKAFYSSATSSAENRKIQTESCRFRDRKIVVVDGLNLYLTTLECKSSISLFAEEINYVMSATPCGYQAILLVLRVGSRLFKEHVETIMLLKNFFGDNFFKDHCILVFTYRDHYEKELEAGMPIQEWCNNQDGALNDILNECNNRAVLFNNQPRDEAERCDQLSILIQMVDGLGIHTYSKEKFVTAKDALMKIQNK